MLGNGLLWLCSRGEESVGWVLFGMQHYDKVLVALEVCVTAKRVKWLCNDAGMILTGGDDEVTGEATLPIPNFSTTNLTWTELGSNPGFPVTGRRLIVWAMANYWVTSEILTINRHCLNLLNPTGHVMHKRFDIQQLYVLPTLYLCVLYLSENKQRLVPLTA